MPQKIKDSPYQNTASFWLKNNLDTWPKIDRFIYIIIFKQVQWTTYPALGLSEFVPPRFLFLLVNNRIQRQHPGSLTTNFIGWFTSFTMFSLLKGSWDHPRGSGYHFQLGKPEKKTGRQKKRLWQSDRFRNTSSWCSKRSLCITSSASKRHRKGPQRGQNTRGKSRWHPTERTWGNGPQEVL